MEKVYYFPHPSVDETPAVPQVRWLKEDELDAFNLHLQRCGQKACSAEQWNAMVHDGTMYCGYFVDGQMIARAAVEKLSEEVWEVSDVRVAREFRNRGYAKQVCLNVLKYILENGKTATIRTEEDNMAMQRVIHALGFRPMA